MKAVTYLTLTKRGVKNTRRTRPFLNSGEVAIKLTLNISDKFFERFIPSTELNIPDSMVIEPQIATKPIEAQPLAEEEKKVEIEVLQEPLENSNTGENHG